MTILKPGMSANEVSLKLETGIPLGQPFLLEGVTEHIETLFEQVLSQQVTKSGGSYKLKLGEKFVDYNQDFRFYVTSKLSNPHYQPEICIKVTLLNFLVTMDGLEDQMLNIVVGKEEPEKEAQRQSNVKEYFIMKHKKKQAEDGILTSLSDSKGDILDNEVLIN